MKLYPAVFLSALSFSGCSTVPVPVPQFSGSVIAVVRDTGFFGAGCTFAVLIDGEIVGKVNAGETVAKKVDSGKHRVAIDNTTPICTNVKMSKVVDIAGSPAVFRIGITSDGQTIFDQVE